MDNGQIAQLKYLLEKVDDLRFIVERSKPLISPVVAEDLLVDFDNIKRKITKQIPFEEKIILKTGKFLDVVTLQKMLNENFNLNGNDWTFYGTNKEKLVQFIKSKNIFFENNEDCESNKLNVYCFECDKNSADEIYFVEIITFPGCVYFGFGSDNHKINFSGFSYNDNLKDDFILFKNKLEKKDLYNEKRN